MIKLRRTQWFGGIACIVLAMSSTTAFAQQTLCPKWSLQYWKQAGLLSPDTTQFLPDKVLGNNQSGSQMLEEMLACFDAEFNTKATSLGGAQWRSNAALAQQYQEFDRLRMDYLMGQAGIAATHKVAPYPSVAYLNKQRELLTARITGMTMTPISVPTPAAMPTTPPAAQPTAAPAGAPTATQNQTVQLRSVNIANSFIRHRNGIGALTTVLSELDKKDSSFVMRPGLAGAGLSFESVNFPGHFLRHANGQIRLAKNETSDQFKKDATFQQRNGLAGKGVSFESVNFPGFYIRHCGGMIFIDNAKGANKACSADMNIAMQDVSFEIVGGSATLPQQPQSVAQQPVPSQPTQTASTGLPQGEVDACIKYVDDKFTSMQSKFDVRQSNLTAIGDSTFNTRNSNLKVFSAYKGQVDAAKNLVLQQRSKKSCDDAKAAIDQKEVLFPQQIR